MSIKFYIQIALIHTDPVSERTPTELNVCSIRNLTLRGRGAIVLKSAFWVTLISSISNLTLNSYQNKDVLNIQFIDLKGFTKHLILMPRVETVLSNLSFVEIRLRCKLGWCKFCLDLQRSPSKISFILHNEIRSFRLKWPPGDKRM